MENHNWSQIAGSRSAPYLNSTLLPAASYATRYYNPSGVHPSEPNYLWLEAGTNFGIRDDSAPATNHQATTQHLVSLLTAGGLTWKAYQEGISGSRCPVAAGGLYAPKHNPMVYFDDVTNHNSPSSAYCIAHERPYSELAADLAQNTVAAYNFITPDLCDDMHNSVGCASTNSVRNGDTWLAGAVPPILQSAAYQQGGVLFITWDEGEGGDGPIGLLVLSPFAKGHGYASAVHYTHSALLRTVQEILGVTPLLGAAATSPDLRDLFQQFPW
jgi:phospholipase C